MEVGDLHEKLFELSIEGLFLRGRFSGLSLTPQLFAREYIVCKTSQERSQIELAERFEESLVKLKRRAFIESPAGIPVLDGSLNAEIWDVRLKMQAQMESEPIGPRERFDPIGVMGVVFEDALGFRPQRPKRKGAYSLTRGKLRRPIRVDLEFGHLMVHVTVFVAARSLGVDCPLSLFFGDAVYLRCDTEQQLAHEFSAMLPHLEILLNELDALQPD